MNGGKPPKPGPREKKITGKKGAFPPRGVAAKTKPPRAKGKSQTRVMSMMGKTPFELKAKKPEPDDRPRPARPPSTNKNMGKTKGARMKRLNGIMI